MDKEAATKYSDLKKIMKMTVKQMLISMKQAFLEKRKSQPEFKHCLDLIGRTQNGVLR